MTAPVAPPAPTAAGEPGDARGVPQGTRSAEAAAHFEAALWLLCSQGDTPEARLADARAADPGWALPLLAEAGWRLTLNHPADVAAGLALLDAAGPLLAGAPARERGHHAALRLLAEGRWTAACQAWDALLLEQPLDALALQAVHHWDHVRGDAAHLRLRPARVLPEWDHADPLFPALLGLYAFGLGECQQFALAEELGRRAAASAAVPVAVHAVTHVLDQQGRFDEGASFLRQQQPAWVGTGRLASHLWWHQALFRLEALDIPGVLRLVDTHLSGEALAHGVQYVDAAALLWRLRLLDVEVDALFRQLLARWQPDPDQAGRHAFIDTHVVMALLGAGDLAGAEAWVARCAERVVRGDEAATANAAVAREVGLPLLRALLAEARGEHAAAARGLYAAHDQSQRLGGSAVQRDLLAQTLMAVAARGPAHAAPGRAVLNERCLAKPLTPLTRHWAGRLGVHLA